MIRANFEGMNIAVEKLAGIAGSNRVRLMDMIGAHGEASTQERFEDSIGPDGKRWKRSIRGGKTLVDSARLQSSITHNATETRAEWGTNVLYAGIHQFGGVILPKTAKKLAFRVGNRFVTASKVTMPARPFVGINAADRSAIEGIVGDWILGVTA